jgi:hypothetical protein
VWAGGTFSPVVLLCQFSVLAGNRFWFYILLMCLEYHTVGCHRVQLVGELLLELLVRGSNPSGVGLLQESVVRG